MAQTPPQQIGNGPNGISPGCMLLPLHQGTFTTMHTTELIPARRVQCQYESGRQALCPSTQVPALSHAQTLVEPPPWQIPSQFSTVCRNEADPTDRERVIDWLALFWLLATHHRYSQHANSQCYYLQLCKKFQMLLWIQVEGFPNFIVPI